MSEEEKKSESEVERGFAYITGDDIAFMVKCYLDLRHASELLGNYEPPWQESRPTNKWYKDVCDHTQMKLDKMIDRQLDVPLPDRSREELAAMSEEEVADYFNINTAAAMRAQQCGGNDLMNREVLKRVGEEKVRRCYKKAEQKKSNALLRASGRSNTRRKSGGKPPKKRRKKDKKKKKKSSKKSRKKKSSKKSRK